MIFLNLWTIIPSVVEQALSLDLDGVIFPRPPFQLKASLHWVREGNSIYVPPTVVPRVRRTISDEPLNLGDQVSLFFHRRRKVPDRMRNLITIAALGDVDIYGNTGRPNKRAWVNMTFSSLENAGIRRYFKNIFFKPEGARTRDSKIAAVAELRDRYIHVTHFDDNPEDALPIARLFPDVKVVVVQDLTAGLLFSRVEMERYPNVRRVAASGRGVLV